MPVAPYIGAASMGVPSTSLPPGAPANWGGTPPAPTGLGGQLPPGWGGPMPSAGALRPPRIGAGYASPIGQSAPSMGTTTGGFSYANQARPYTTPEPGAWGNT